MSQVTSHILDTSKGRPAAGIVIILLQAQDDQWTEIANGITNNDGRVADLLEKGDWLQHGAYKMRFETKNYFEKDHVHSFYPYIEIIFDVITNEHYHIPLLLSPFGYSTYRGS